MENHMKTVEREPRNVQKQDIEREGREEKKGREEANGSIGTTQSRLE